MEFLKSRMNRVGGLPKIFGGLLLVASVGCTSFPSSRTPSGEAVTAWESTYYSSGPRAKQIGESRLNYRVWSPAPKEAEAILIIVHGLRSHSGKYDAFARQLVGANPKFEVWAYDQLSHGKSDNWNLKPNPPVSGSIESIDELSQHLSNFVDFVAEKRPNRPIYILSHSMGGLVSFQYGLRTERQLAGMIYLAPALEYFSDAWIDRLKTLSVKLAGPVPGIKKLPLPHEALDLLETNFIDLDKFTHDPMYKANAQKDPLIHSGSPNVITGYSLIKSIDEITALRESGSTTAFAKVPLMFMHGSGDKVTNPAGSYDLFNWTKYPLNIRSDYGGSPDKPETARFVDVAADGSVRIEWENAFHDLFAEKSSAHSRPFYYRENYEQVAIEWLKGMEAIRTGQLSAAQFQLDFAKQAKSASLSK